MYEILTSPDFLSTRELAAIFWFLIFISWAFGQRKIRAQLPSLIRSMFPLKLSLLWFAGLGWLSIGVWVLYAVHLWTAKDLKDTLLWAFTAGVFILVYGVIRKSPYPDYRNVVLGLFGISVLLELLLSAYCYSLGVEMLLFLVTVVVAALHAYSGAYEKFRAVNKITTFLMFVIGLAMLWKAFAGFVDDPRKVLTLDSFIGIVRPIFFTFWMLPLSYALALFAAYETLFVPFLLGQPRGVKFKFLSRLYLVAYFRLSLNDIINSTDRLFLPLKSAKSVQDVRHALASMHTQSGSGAD